MSPSFTYCSNALRVRLPPFPLKPPIAMTASPPVASSSDAAVDEPLAAAIHLYCDASFSRYLAREELTAAPPAPPPPGLPVPPDAAPLRAADAEPLPPVVVPHR